MIKDIEQPDPGKAIRSQKTASRIVSAPRHGGAFSSAAFDALVEISAILDGAGGIIAVNKAWREFASKNGADDRTIRGVGLNYVKVCETQGGFGDREQAAAAQHGLKRVLSGTQNIFNLRYPCHSNDVRQWFEMTVTPIEKGGVVVSHRNITAQILEEEMRQQSDARLWAILATSPVPTKIRDDAGNITHINPAFQQTFGYTAEDIPTLKQWGTLVTYAAEPRQEAEKCRDTGANNAAPNGADVTSRELVLRCKDGSQRTVLATTSTLPHGRDSVTVFVDITQRRAIELALRDNEARLRAIIALSPIPIRLNDAAGNVTLVNPAFEQTFGYALADIPTLDVFWSQVFPDPDYRRRVLAKRQEEIDLAAREGTSFSPQELVMRCKDGTDKIVLAGTSTLPHARDFMSVYVDITQRKSIELALQASAAQYRNLAETMQVGVLLQGPDTRILLSNPKALELLGLTNEQLLGKTSLDPDWNVIHEDGTPFPGHTHPAAQAARTGVSFRNVIMGFYRPTHQDRVWLQVSATPQFNLDGTLQQVIVTFADLTDRKRAERALQESEQRQQLALSGGGLGLWDWNVVSGDTVYDGQWCALIGYAPEELRPVISTWRGLLHPEDAPGVYQLLDRHLLNDVHDYEVDFRIRHKQGHWVWMHSRGRVMERDAGGKPLRMTGTCMDITARKRAQEGLENALRALERKQSALTEVLNTIQAQKDALGKGVLSNVDALIMPRLEQLRNSATRDQARVLSQIESSLREITSPFASTMQTQGRSLTTVELRICDSIRQGLAVKEIARLEGISPATVSTHRKNIRRKLGLSHKKANLCSYLQSLQNKSDALRE